MGRGAVDQNGMMMGGAGQGGSSQSGMMAGQGQMGGGVAQCPHVQTQPKPHQPGSN